MEIPGRRWLRRRGRKPRGVPRLPRHGHQRADHQSQRGPPLDRPHAYYSTRSSTRSRRSSRARASSTSSATAARWSTRCSTSPTRGPRSRGQELPEEDDAVGNRRVTRLRRPGATTSRLRWRSATSTRSGPRSSATRTWSRIRRQPSAASMASSASPTRTARRKFLASGRINSSFGERPRLRGSQLWETWEADLRHIFAGHAGTAMVRSGYWTPDEFENATGQLTANEEPSRSGTASSRPPRTAGNSLSQESSRS